MGFWANKLEQEMKEERFLYEEAYQRVAPLVGKTAKQIVQELPSTCSQKDRTKILKQLGQIVHGQQKPIYHEKIDHAVLTLVNYQNSRGSQCNPGLKKAYADFYYPANKFQKLEKERGSILEGFGVANVRDHPFLEALKAVPMAYIDTLKSAEVYNQLPKILQKEHPDIFRDRRLTVLYPASGGKLSPVLAATWAMDSNWIDSAEFTYTERNHQFVSRLHTQFQAIQEWGRQQGKNVIQNYRYKIDEFSSLEGGGVEVKFSFQYLTKKGKLKDIDLIFALKRSGEKYYRDEYIKKADLVLFDDSIKLPSSGAFVMKNRRSEGKQLVLIENSDFVLIDDSKYKQRVIPGQYGHCFSKYPIFSQDGVENAYVEYSQCVYNSALLLQLPR